MRVLELFGGIGACSKALERLNINCEIVDYVEIDKYAVKSFNAIHNTNFEPQDITQWDKNIDVDLIMHGSPCQDFSLAGLQAGGDEGSGTRSSLMYETIRIVKKLKPKYVVWENVKNLLSKKHKHNFDIYIYMLEQLGYKSYYQVLNAKDYGIPQNRERVFTISIRNDIDKEFIFPAKQELKLRLKDMLEDEVDEKYYLSDDKISSIAHWKAYQKPFEKVQGKESIVPTLTARGAGEEHSGMITVCDELENTTNLQEQCLNVKKTFVEKKYEKFAEENGYIPEMFNPYNESEIKDVAPAQTTQCGSTGSSATVLLKKDTENYIEWEEKGKLDCDCRAYKEDKISGAIMTTPKNKVLLKEQLCNKLIEEGKVKEFDVIRHSYSKSRMKDWENRNIEKNNEVPTLDTRCDCLGVTVANVSGLRIRKLTPKECWRLMGFNDEDYEKASKVNTNTQLYKQAGNSIVVNVLESIFKNLFSEYINETSND